MKTCPVCCETFRFLWTDHHGIGACLTCNAPIKIYHYNDAKEREDKPPKSMIADGWLPILIRYWEEKHRLIPNGLNIPGSRYERCDEGDFREWHAWLEEHESELPQAENEDNSANG